MGRYDDDYNPYIDTTDTCNMSENELKSYGLRRLRIMLLMEKDAEEFLKVNDSPLQRMVVETAHHNVERCEQKYGVKRQDIITPCSISLL